MPFFPKDYEKMVSTGLQRMRANTTVSQLSPGAKARFLLETVLTEQAAQYSHFDINMMQAFVRWAEGRFLDLFGDIMQVPRWLPTVASVDIDHSNFMFYVDSGTFGDVNKGMDFVIPAGTTVSTADFDVEMTQTTESSSSAVTSRELPKITYTTQGDVVCSASHSHVYVSIKAQIEGGDSDVPRNALLKHNFTSYSMSERGLLKCRNKYSITNGRDRESDESYRYRLMNAFKAKERANKIAVRLAALSVPGVADLAEINCEQGPGTYSLYVESVGATASPGLIGSIAAAVEPVSAFGVRPFVLAPIPLGLSFVVALRWRDKTTETEKLIVQANIREMMEGFLNSHGIGDNVNLEALAASVATTSEEIVGLGYLQAGKFEEVYVHRSSPDGGGVKKTLFEGDTVTSLYNERPLLETSTRYRGIQFL